MRSRLQTLDWVTTHALEQLRQWFDGISANKHVVIKEREIDLVVESGSWTLAIECKASTEPASVRAAVDTAKSFVALFRRKTIPVVVVPFMGALGRELCRAAEVSWFDLSGNADIRGPGLRISVDGRPNKFVHRGRPANVFAPKSSRVVRQLVINYPRPLRQQELVELTHLDDGFMSRLAHRLVESGYLETTSDGALRLREPDLLIDAWREAYEFEGHYIIKGHVSARNSSEMIERISATLAKAQIRHAMTGLAGAWLHTSFAGFRTATVYLDEKPEEALQRDLGLHIEERGANAWLVIPNDEGVYDGARAIDGVNVVHPVQVFLDLKGHPERAREASDELRKRLLRWET